jgi:hypothetical protein
MIAADRAARLREGVLQPLRCWRRCGGEFLRGRDAVSQRLLHEPWMFSVTYVTPRWVQRRFVHARWSGH